MDTPDPTGEAPTKKRHALSPAPPEEADQAAWERTVARDMLVGRKLGDYVVTHRLGAGGMGVVYAAEEPRIGRKVAIKVIRPDRNGERGLLEEARNSNAVRHRGIVDVYAFGELPGVGEYLVMEYLEGKALDVVLTERGRFAPIDAIPILDEVVAALEAAHSRGVIHRDLKPSNIFLIDEAGGAQYAKILDFGLAKKSSVTGDLVHQTRVSAVVGTPHYMAPEQAMGKPVGPKTDLYAVGIIAFELLTGDIPFNGQTPMEIAIKQVNEAPPSPGSIVPLPEALNELILSLLEKDPQARPSSSTVRQTLRRIHRDLAAANTQVGVPTRGLRAMTSPGVAARGAQPAPPPREQRPPANGVATPAVERAREPSVARARPQVHPTAPAPHDAVGAKHVSTIEELPVSTRSSRTRWIALGVAAVVLVGVGAFVALRSTQSPGPAPRPLAPRDGSAPTLPPVRVEPEGSADRGSVGSPATRGEEAALNPAPNAGPGGERGTALDPRSGTAVVPSARDTSSIAAAPGAPDSSPTAPSTGPSARDEAPTGPLPSARDAAPTVTTTGPSSREGASAAAAPSGRDTSLTAPSTTQSARDGASAAPGAHASDDGAAANGASATRTERARVRQEAAGSKRTAPAGPAERVASPEPSSSSTASATQEPGQLTVLVLGGLAAEVFVDDERWGFAPIKFRPVTSGRRKLRIVLSNGVSHEQTVLVPEARLAEVRKRWDATTGTLRDL